ncbi:MAG TPA: anti-sigma factor [Sphingomicrobium sp.]|nr:anti-sigma factor [Sphingomicrobium sp.]
MMTERPESELPEPDVAAAELALGLLEGDERAAALRRVLAEPKFAREVENWRTHFGALFASVPEVSPSAELGSRVIGRLDGAPPAGVERWKRFSFVSSLAAASLLGILLSRPAPPPPQPPAAVQPAPLFAALTIEGKTAPIVAVYDTQRGTVRMPGPLLNPDGKSAQLWAIVGDEAPQPLGTFRHIGNDLVEAGIGSVPAIAPGTTIAVSIEPLGGSPTGLPTGPVVASGTLTRV